LRHTSHQRFARYPEKFRQITWRGELSTVLADIDAARAAGLQVKINIVALKASTKTSSTA
jgi:molybdenum cofactor biosynthesis enzyme MoaA